MGLNLKTSEIELNFVKDRVSGVQRHIDEINLHLLTYINKLASLRDCGDEIAKSISNFASKENYNQTLRLSLGQFSDVLLSIQEYRDAEIQRILVKVIHQLENYSPHCKNTKADIKKCFDSRVKEIKKKNDLEKARSKAPNNWQKIAQAEKEVNQAQEEAARMTQELESLVSWFEKKKLDDIKSIFMEFVKIEMIFHAKAIELYSKAYNILKEIKVDDDLQEFKSHFKARLSSLDEEVILPSKSTTVPKVLDTNPDISYHLNKPHASKSGQGIPRSILTLTTPMAQPCSSSESFIDGTDLN